MTSPDRLKKLYESVRNKKCRNVRFKELESLLLKHGWELHKIARNNHYLYAHPEFQGFVGVAKPHKGSDIKTVYCRNALKAIEEIEGYDD
jgi:hypothetical protein